MLGPLGFNFGSLAPSWAILAPSLAFLGQVWGHLGAILGALGAILLSLGGFWGPSGAQLVAILGHPWDIQGQLADILGVFGPVWGHLGDIRAFCAHLGAILGLSGASGEAPDLKKHRFSTGFLWFLMLGRPSFNSGRSYQPRRSGALGKNACMQLRTPILARFPFPC